MIRTVLAAAALAFALPAAAADAGDTYYELHYAYEVAAHCGLADAGVERGFRDARKRLAELSELDDDALKRHRIHAIVAAEREYQNRGLGGYRPWCRTEGKEARRRILQWAAGGN